jgi:predicted acetyltransferase
MKDVSLVAPHENLREAFEDFQAEFPDRALETITGIGSMGFSSFSEAVVLCGAHKKGEALQEGLVPASTYWLMKKGRMLGSINLRHELNDFLRNVGGHVGYSIRPSERGKGYGYCMLRLLFEEARNLNLKKLLITCNAENAASRALIEKAGGVFEVEKRVDYPGEGECLFRLYWIELQ